MAKKLKCPKCKSHNVQVVDGKKKVSLAKGAVGGALFGPIGAVAGGAGLGKKGKYQCFCMNCGHRFKIK